MLDYIIVGCGLAGIAFSESALTANKSFVVFNNDSQNSSKIAAGLFNPVILKRFTATPNAIEQIELLVDFYCNLEKKLNTKLLFEMPILRKFYSLEEQNNWFIAADNPQLNPFLNTNLVYTKFSGVDSPFGFGKVNATGYVDTAELTSKYALFLNSLGSLYSERFEYSEIEFNEDFIQYKNLKCKHIIFAEGFGMHTNPFFNKLPLDGTKGEIIVVKAPNLSLNTILNSSLYVVPLGGQLFKIGATYNWDDKSALPTKDGKAELVTKLQDIISCEFEVVSHLAGVRPTVKDRNPIVGTHFEHKNIHILNGLGTRGVMLAPFLAQKLFDCIENGIALPRTLDCKRYFSV